MAEGIIPADDDKVNTTSTVLLLLWYRQLVTNKNSPII